MRWSTPRRATAVAALALAVACPAAAAEKFYARAIEVDRFLLEYLPNYEPYGALRFDISAASVDSNLNANLNFELVAYGMHVLNETIHLCDLVGGILCPLPQYQFIGSATIPLPASIGKDVNIPSVGYWIPNLEATATVRLLRTSDGSEAACLNVELSNGETVRHSWVSWILGGFVFLTILLSALWFLVGTLVYPSASLLASSSPLAANAIWASLGRRKERLLLLFSLFQFVATTGLLSLNYPNVYTAWTGNYAWSLGIIREKPIVNDIDQLRNNTGGNLTRLAGTSGIVGGTEALQSIFANNYVVPQALPSAQEVGTALLDEMGNSRAARNASFPSASGLATRALTQSASLVKRAIPYPKVQQPIQSSSFLHLGLPHWLISLNISPYDAFMVAFINFLFLFAIAIALILLGAAVWALFAFTSRRRAERRRRALGVTDRDEEKRAAAGFGYGHAGGRFSRTRGMFEGPFWTVVRANTLRLLMISWYPLLLFTFFQWIIGSSDSYAPIILSVFTIVFVAGALLLLGARFFVLARRALRGPTSSVGEEGGVYTEKHVVHSSPFRETPVAEPITPNTDPKHALKKSERRDVEVFTTGAFLSHGLGSYSPFWAAYKTRSRRTVSKRRNWWKGSGWWFGLIDLVLAPFITALFIGFAVNSGWVQSVALVAIQAILLLLICIWTPFEDKSSNATHILWAICRVVIAGALIPFNESIGLNEIARTAIGFVLAIIEMVLAALFGVLLAIDLVQLIVFFARGMKARRHAHRRSDTTAVYADSGAGLPPMTERTAPNRTTRVEERHESSRGSGSSETLANSPGAPPVGTQDYATGPKKLANPAPTHY